MFLMSYGMTIRTKNNKIIERIVIFIFIIMMNSKYLWERRISAIKAFTNQSSIFKRFSGALKISRFGLFHCFTFAKYRTKFSIMRRRCSEFFITIKTFLNYCAIKMLSLIITFSGTIYCFSFSASNILKLLITYFTIRNKLFLSGFTSTKIRTIYCFFKSIFGDIKFFFANPTLNNFASFNHKGVLLCH